MNCHKLLCERGVMLMTSRSLKVRSSKGKFWAYILGRKTKTKTKTPRTDKSKRYAESLCLPKTSFPLSVKDGLAAKRELEIQRVRPWCHEHVQQNSTQFMLTQAAAALQAPLHSAKAHSFTNNI